MKCKSTEASKNGFIHFVIGDYKMAVDCEKVKGRLTREEDGWRLIPLKQPRRPGVEAQPEADGEHSGTCQLQEKVMVRVYRDDDNDVAKKPQAGWWNFCRYCEKPHTAAVVISIQANAKLSRQTLKLDLP